MLDEHIWCLCVTCRSHSRALLVASNFILRLSAHTLTSPFVSSNLIFHKRVLNNQDSIPLAKCLIWYSSIDLQLVKSAMHWFSYRYLWSILVHCVLNGYTMYNVQCTLYIVHGPPWFIFLRLYYVSCGKSCCLGVFAWVGRQPGISNSSRHQDLTLDQRSAQQTTRASCPTRASPLPKLGDPLGQDGVGGEGNAVDFYKLLWWTSTSPATQTTGSHLLGINRPPEFSSFFRIINLCLHLVSFWFAQVLSALLLLTSSLDAAQLPLPAENEEPPLQLVFPEGAIIPPPSETLQLFYISCLDFEAIFNCLQLCWLRGKYL